MDFNQTELQLPPDLQVSSVLLSKRQEKTHMRKIWGGAERNWPDGKKTNEAISSWANGW